MRCPTCGDPVMIRGDRWECGWCTDFGFLPRSAAVPKEITFQLTLSVPCDEDAEPSAPPRISADEARKRLSKGNFSGTEDICLVILADAYPEELSGDELDAVSWYRVLDDVMAEDTEKGIRMWRTLLDAAMPALQNDRPTAETLLYDWSALDDPSDSVAEAFLAALEDEHFRQQLFGSAYVGSLPLTLLHLCSDFGHAETARRCRQTALQNPHLTTPPKAPLPKNLRRITGDKKETAAPSLFYVQFHDG